MEKSKLRLKEKNQGPGDSRAWLHARFAQPKLPSAMEQLFSAIKRIGYTIMVALAIISIFLAIPFQRWDDYSIWMRVQESLRQLETRPDSLPAFQNVWAAAEAAHVLWTAPNGARPEKWYQSVQRNRYDACYGLIQTLALGMIKNGDVQRGLRELDQLQQRTGLHSLPHFPSKDQIITPCTNCRNGQIEKKCRACDGSGGCKRCNRLGSLSVPSQSKSFPLDASLGGTRRQAKRLGAENPIHQNCPDCHATGKCTICAGAGKHVIGCTACGGKLTIMNFAAYPDVFGNTVRCTTTAVNRTIKLKYIIHSLTNAQSYILHKGRETCCTVLSTARGDGVITGTRSSASSQRPMQKTSPLLREHPLNQQAEKQRIWKVLAGAFILIVGLLFVSMRRQRRKTHGLNTLPGMEHFDTRNLTDPLALTAQESRNRVENTTTQPQPADKT